MPPAADAGLSPSPARKDRVYEERGHAAAAPASCQYKTHCKGDRICPDGQCVEATPAAAAPAAQ